MPDRSRQEANSFVIIFDFDGQLRRSPHRGNIPVSVIAESNVNRPLFESHKEYPYLWKLASESLPKVFNSRQLVLCESIRQCCTHNQMSPSSIRRCIKETT
jgi:hypothetical protein